MAGYSYGHGFARRDPIPPGWADCPDMGEVSDLHTMIPMKVCAGTHAHGGTDHIASAAGSESPCKTIGAVYHSAARHAASHFSEPCAGLYEPDDIQDQLRAQTLACSLSRMCLLVWQ